MAPRRRKPSSPLPTFDPNPSLEFGAELLLRVHAEHALIGKVAMWHWLDDPADHEYTKDVDFAVSRSALPAIIEAVRKTDAELRLLPIGGVNARRDSDGIRVDFIDRSNEEYGDLNPLYADAITAANYSEDRAGGVPVASPEHLIAMKLGAATDKDEKDAIRLIAKVEDLDVEKVRDLLKRFVGAAGIGRFDECLRRAGHPKARRAYTGGGS